jgi:hypothetical protein
VGINKKIRPCPQHALGGSARKPSYLLRTCPDCMKWLARHPGDSRLATQFIPGTYASSARGAYDFRADRSRSGRGSKIGGSET